MAAQEEFVVLLIPVDEEDSYSPEWSTVSDVTDKEESTDYHVKAGSILLLDDGDDDLNGYDHDDEDEEMPLHAEQLSAGEFQRGEKVSCNGPTKTSVDSFTDEGKLQPNKTVNQDDVMEIEENIQTPSPSEVESKDNFKRTEMSLHAEQPIPQDEANAAELKKEDAVSGGGPTKTLVDSFMDEEKLRINKALNEHSIIETDGNIPIPSPQGTETKENFEKEMYRLSEQDIIEIDGNISTLPQGTEIKKNLESASNRLSNTSAMSSHELSGSFSTMWSELRVKHSIIDTNKLIACATRSEECNNSVMDSKHNSPCPVLERPFTCQCSAAFKKTESLAEHLKTFHKKLFSCELCGMGFKTEFDREVHVLSFLKWPFCCKRCHVHFRSKDELTQHSNVHYMYSCRICSAQFKSKDGLRLHTAKHTDSYVICEQCCELRGSRLILRQHVRKHLRLPLAFPCKWCMAQFDTEEALKWHFKAHSDLLLTCDRCFAQFETEKLLEDHETTHADLPFFCNFCTKTFPTEKTFLQHSVVHHIANVCTWCTKRFGNIKDLKRHSATHGRRFLCNKCSATFKDETRLKDHSSAHTLFC